MPSRAPLGCTVRAQCVRAVHSAHADSRQMHVRCTEPLDGSVPLRAAGWMRRAVGWMRTVCTQYSATRASANRAHSRRRHVDPNGSLTDLPTALCLRGRRRRGAGLEPTAGAAAEVASVASAASASAPAPACSAAAVSWLPAWSRCSSSTSSSTSISRSSLTSTSRSSSRSAKLSPAACRQGQPEAGKGVSEQEQ